MKKDLKKAESSRPKRKAAKKNAERSPSPVDIAELEALFSQMEVDDG